MEGEFPAEIGSRRRAAESTESCVEEGLGRPALPLGWRRQLRAPFKEENVSGGST